MGRTTLQRDRQALAPQGKGSARGGRIVGLATATERLSVSEAVVRLGSVYELERYSPLGDRPCLVVDMSAAAGAPEVAAVDIARRALAELACPSVLVVSERDRGSAAIEVLFDVVVSTDAELDAVLSGVERSPLASAALVQLLRASEGRSLHEALIAESFVYSTLQGGPEFTSWIERHRSRARAAGAPLPAEGPAVRIERDGARLDVTLDRPERRNAFSAEMRDALVDALSLAVSDESLTDIVLRGAGDAFSAGGDLDEFGEFADPATAHAIRSTRNAGRLLARCRERLRAEVHGACVGAGVELPAFAGRVCARSDAFFELPEISMGLIPGAGGTASIPPRIGRQRTAYLALSGARVDAATALEWGLVDAVR